MRRYTGREGQERYLVMLLDEDDDSELLVLILVLR